MISTSHSGRTAGIQFRAASTGSVMRRSLFGSGRNLGGRDQANEADPHPFDNEERHQGHSTTPAPSCRHIGCQHRKTDILADGRFAAVRIAPVEIMVAEHPHIDTHF